MNMSKYGILSMICTDHGGIPEVITRRDFDDILMGFGDVESLESCKTRWDMMVEVGWFDPIDDCSCRINTDIIIHNLQRFEKDVGFRVSDRYEVHSLLNDLLGRVANIGYDVIFFDS